MRVGRRSQSMIQQHRDCGGPTLSFPTDVNGWESEGFVVGHNLLRDLSTINQTDSNIAKDLQNSTWPVPNATYLNFENFQKLVISIDYLTCDQTAQLQSIVQSTRSFTNWTVQGDMQGEIYKRPHLWGNKQTRGDATSLTMNDGQDSATLFRPPTPLVTTQPPQESICLSV